MHLDYKISQQEINNVKRPHGRLGALLFEFQQSGKPMAKLQDLGQRKANVFAGYVGKVIKQKNLPLYAVCRGDVVYIINKTLAEDI